MLRNQRFSYFFASVIRRLEMVLYVYPNVNTNYCYYLPEGVGLNLCIEPYINEVYTTTDAKYILTNYNDGTYAMYTEWGWKVIAQGQQFVLYQRQ